MAGTELATAYVSITASAKGLQKSLQSELDSPLVSAGASAGSKAGDSFLSSWKGKMALAGAATAAGVAVAGGAIVKMGLETASQFEQAGIAFKNFLGPAADEFTAKLKDFAKNTPFQFGELQQYASSLLSVGVEAGRIVPIMTAIGDAASARGLGAEAIGRATTALTQMQQKGKVTGEEMLQLAEAGVPAWDALAAVLGVSVAEAQDRVSKGQVQVNDLFKALETNAGPGLQRVTGMMEQQSKSLAGLWSNLQDTLGQGLADAFGPAIPAIKDALNQLVPALQPILGGLGSLLAPLTKLLIPLLDGMKAIITPLLPPLTQFAETLGGALKDAMVTLAPSITSFMTALGPILPLVADLAKLFIDTFAPVLRDLFTALAPVVTQLVDALKPVLEEIKPDLPQIAESMGELAKSFGELLIALMPILGPLLEVFTKIESAKWKIFSGIIDGIAGAFSFLAEVVEGFFPTMQIFWDTFMKGVSFVGDTLGGLVETIENIGDAILGTFQDAFNGIARFWNEGIGSWSIGFPDWFPPPFGGKAWDVPDMPIIAHNGGVVPGRIGEDMLMRLTAGEVVLSRAQVAAVAAGPGGGGGPILVHSTLQVDGRVLAQATAEGVRKTDQAFL